MIEKLADSILEIIQSPAKSAVATISGLLTGYVPTTLASITNETAYPLDIFFQRFVWTLTSIVAITAIISWVQKQIDRRKKRKLGIYD